MTTLSPNPNPLLIDSHCHLHMIDYAKLETNMDSVVAAAHNAGVGQMICVSTDFSEYDELLRIANTYPQVSISVGIHPNESQAAETPDAEKLIRLGSHEKVVALGETGLDYYRDQSQVAEQKAWFQAHIDASRQLKKPLIIHTRMAKADTLAIAKSERLGDLGAVLHCFTEDWDMAKQAIDLGMLISFSGIITFKNADDLREVVKNTPLDSLLIETDAPFLAPMPYRGKINQPAYVKEVATWVASIKGVSFETVAQRSAENAIRLFKLK